MDIEKIMKVVAEESDRSFSESFTAILRGVSLRRRTIVEVIDGSPYVSAVCTFSLCSKPGKTDEVIANLILPDPDAISVFNEGDYEEVFILRNYFQGMLEACEAWLTEQNEHD